MRPLVVLLILGALEGALAVSLVARGRATPATRALPPPGPSPVAADAAAPAASPTDAADGGALGHPLRVTALGWEIAAPGLLVNGGFASSPAVTSSGALPMVVRVASTPTDVEAALARGGADTEGADVAIVPLPVMVASYERLRALQPDVFFVTGWAEGREALTGRSAGGLSASLGGREVEVTGTPGTASAFLAAEVLALAGAEPERIRWVAPNGNPIGTEFAAVEREPATRDASARAVLLTTADATRLTPFVAVAPHSFASRHPDVLRRWATLWLAGTQRLHDDPADAARTIAAMQGAPDALALVSRLGMIGQSGLADNARVMGLSGRGAVTLSTLFHHAWRDWRAAGLLTTPEPDVAPLATDTVVALVRASPTRASETPTPPRPAVAGRPPLLTWRLPGARLDEGAVVETGGWIAGVFERATVQVRMRDAPALGRTVETVRARFGIAEARVAAVPVARSARGPLALVEAHLGR